MTPPWARNCRDMQEELRDKGTCRFVYQLRNLEPLSLDT